MLDYSVNFSQYELDIHSWSLYEFDSFMCLKESLAPWIWALRSLSPLIKKLILSPCPPCGSLLLLHRKPLVDCIPTLTCHLLMIFIFFLACVSFNYCIQWIGSKANGYWVTATKCSPRQKRTALASVQSGSLYCIIIKVDQIQRNKKRWFWFVLLVTDATLRLVMEVSCCSEDVLEKKSLQCGTSARLSLSLNTRVCTQTHTHTHKPAQYIVSKPSFDWHVTFHYG